MGAHPVDQLPRLDLVRVIGASEQLFDDRLDGKFAQPLGVHPAQIEIERQRQLSDFQRLAFRVDLVGEHLATHRLARAVLPQQRAKRRRGLILCPFDQRRDQIHPGFIGAGSQTVFILAIERSQIPGAQLGVLLRVDVSRKLSGKIMKNIFHAGLFIAFARRRMTVGWGVVWFYQRGCCIDDCSSNRLEKPLFLRIMTCFV